MPSSIQPSSSVRGLSLSPSGSHLAVLRHDSLSVHNITPSTNVLEDSDLTTSLKPSAELLDVVWSSTNNNDDDFVLYTGGADGVVGWGVGDDGKLGEVWMKEIKDGVGCVAVGGGKVFAGGKDGVIRVWNGGVDGGLVRELRGHKLGVRGVDVKGKWGSDNGNIVVSGGRDSTVRVWDLRVGEKGGEVCCWRGHKGWVHGVAIGDGDAAVSCGGDKTVRLWRIGVGDERVMRGHEFRVWGVAMDEKGTVAVSGSTDATLRVWDLEGGSKSVGEEHRDSVLAVDLTRDGSTAVSGCEDGEVRFWDVCQMLERKNGYSTEVGVEIGTNNEEERKTEVPVDDLLGLDDIPMPTKNSETPSTQSVNKNVFQFHSDGKLLAEESSTVFPSIQNDDAAEEVHDSFSIGKKPTIPEMSSKPLVPSVTAMDTKKTSTAPTSQVVPRVEKSSTLEAAVVVNSELTTESASLTGKNVLKADTISDKNHIEDDATVSYGGSVSQPVAPEENAATVIDSQSEVPSNPAAASEPFVGSQAPKSLLSEAKETNEKILESTELVGALGHSAEQEEKELLGAESETRMSPVDDIKAHKANMGSAASVPSHAQIDKEKALASGRMLQNELHAVQERVTMGAKDEMDEEKDNKVSSVKTEEIGGDQEFPALIKLTEVKNRLEGLSKRLDLLLASS